jgi:hypothetical protein
MPNYIKNRIIIHATPEICQSIFDKYNTHYESSIWKADDDRVICKKSDISAFSVGWFNPNNGEFETREDGISIGIPEGWEMEIKKAFNHFPDFNKIKPQPENIFRGDLGLKEEEMCRRENRPTWYDWNRENWGTKWNSSECEQEKYNSFTFVTAWQGVPNLMLELSKQNEGVEFEYEYADEDTGCNVGSYVFKNGEVEKAFEPQNSSLEAYELAFKLRPHYKNDYHLENGKYV